MHRGLFEQDLNVENVKKSLKYREHSQKDRYMEGLLISNSENNHTFVGLKNQDCVKQGLLCIF